jgi:hypothetical protein
MEARERTASEEARRRERRKEREERHRREKEKIRNGDKRQRKPQGLDIIDKLDVTGIYGQGCECGHVPQRGVLWADILQYSTTMVLSTPATLIAIRNAIAERRCKLSRWALPTWHWEVLAQYLHGWIWTDFTDVVRRVSWSFPRRRRWTRPWSTQLCVQSLFMVRKATV